MRCFPILLAILVLAGCGGRQQNVPPWMRPAEPPRDENFRGGSVAMLIRHDANHDGTLTREELIAGLKAEFAAHDTHKNGCLDSDQSAAINQERVEADKSTATPLQDWNQDGCINYTEFSAAPYSLFSQMDRDNDGKLTPQELHPRRPGSPGSQNGAQNGVQNGPENGPQNGPENGPGNDGPPRRGPGDPPPGQ